MNLYMTSVEYKIEGLV